MNTITIELENEILEVSQTADSSTLNVDVLDLEEELKYYFEIETTELAELLTKYQQDNGIL